MRDLCRALRLQSGRRRCGRAQQRSFCGQGQARVLNGRPVGIDGLRGALLPGRSQQLPRRHTGLQHMHLFTVAHG